MFFLYVTHSTSYSHFKEQINVQICSGAETLYLSFFSKPFEAGKWQKWQRSNSKNCANSFINFSKTSSRIERLLLHRDHEVRQDTLVWITWRLGALYNNLHLRLIHLSMMSTIYPLLGVLHWIYQRNPCIHKDNSISSSIEDSDLSH